MPAPGNGWRCWLRHLHVQSRSSTRGREESGQGETEPFRRLEMPRDRHYDRLITVADGPGTNPAIYEIAERVRGATPTLRHSPHRREEPGGVAPMKVIETGLRGRRVRRGRTGFRDDRARPLRETRVRRRLDDEAAERPCSAETVPPELLAARPVHLHRTGGLTA